METVLKKGLGCGRYFLDFLHEHFMKIPLYRRIFGVFLDRTRKKAEKVKEKLPVYGYLALTLYVAVPLPIPGAYTGCLIAWILNRGDNYETGDRTRGIGQD